MDAKKMEAALIAFVDAIEATGGATVDHKGYTVPVADQEWSDLGEIYEKACALLGRKPKIDDTLYEGPTAEEAAGGPFFDDPGGAECKYCRQHVEDPNHAANCPEWPEEKDDYYVYFTLHVRLRLDGVGTEEAARAQFEKMSDEDAVRDGKVLETEVTSVEKAS